MIYELLGSFVKEDHKDINDLSQEALNVVMLFLSSLQPDVHKMLWMR